MGKKKEKGSGALVNAKAKAEVKVSDIAGIGAAAASPAGKEIAKAVSGPLGGAIETITTALFGRRAAQARAAGRILEAEANAEVRRIEAQVERDLQAIAVPQAYRVIDPQAEEARLLGSVSDRVRATELRRQGNIEDATARAIEIADSRGDDKAKPLDLELTISWIDGVKDAHAEQVRDLYAELLANQTRPDATRISGPSLILLKNLDGYLAAQLEKIVAEMFALGGFPVVHHKPVGSEDQYVQREDLKLLEEIGFVEFTMTNGMFLREMNLRSNEPQYVPNHQIVQLSQRGLNLVNAIFGDRPFEGILSKYKMPEDITRNHYLGLVEELESRRRSGFVLGFSTADLDKVFEVHAQLSDEKFQGGGGIPLIPPFYPYTGKKVDIFELRDLMLQTNAKITPFGWSIVEAIHQRSATMTPYPNVEINAPPSMRRSRRRGPTS